MDVNTAVRKAREAAKTYAGAEQDVRVEEVEQLGDAAWNITLSWVVVDTIKRIQAEHDPLRRMRIVQQAPPLERVFRLFQVQGDQPVKMKRAPDP